LLQEAETALGLLGSEDGALAVPPGVQRPEVNDGDRVALMAMRWNALTSEN